MILIYFILYRLKLGQSLKMIIHFKLILILLKFKYEKKIKNIKFYI